MNLSIIPNGMHTPKDIVCQVAAAYVITGSCGKAAAIVGVPERTVQEWAVKDWWPALIEESRLANQEKIDASLERTIFLAQEAVERRLQHGETVPIKTRKTRRNKDGSTEAEEHIEMVNKPVSMRDAAVVMAISIDKQRILRNLPTSITGNSSEAKLSSLADRIREIERRDEAKVISDQ